LGFAHPGTAAGAAAPSATHLCRMHLSPRGRGSWAAPGRSAVRGSLRLPATLAR